MHSGRLLTPRRAIAPKVEPGAWSLCNAATALVEDLAVHLDLTVEKFFC